jgi:hypothetical protein
MYNFLSSITQGAIIGLIVGIIAIPLFMIMRALLATKKGNSESVEKAFYSLDLSKVIGNLSKAIQIPTISPKIKGENKDAFLEYENYL